jgi:hypothetical protein
MKPQNLVMISAIHHSIVELGCVGEQEGGRHKQENKAQANCHRGQVEGRANSLLSRPRIKMMDDIRSWCEQQMHNKFDYFWETPIKYSFVFLLLIMKALWVLVYSFYGLSVKVSFKPFRSTQYPTPEIYQKAKTIKSALQHFTAFVIAAADEIPLFTFQSYYSSVLSFYRKDIQYVETRKRKSIREYLEEEKRKNCGINTYIYWFNHRILTITHKIAKYPGASQSVAG